MLLMLTLALACVLVWPGTVAADQAFRPGVPGIGDPYFPLDGNGGHDVRHYGLDLRYQPASDLLSGVAAIRATKRREIHATYR
jgi:hypothetical protein